MQTTSETAEITYQVYSPKYQKRSSVPPRQRKRILEQTLRRSSISTTTTSSGDDDLDEWRYLILRQQPPQQKDLQTGNLHSFLYPQLFESSEQQNDAVLSLAPALSPPRPTVNLKKNLDSLAATKTGNKIDDFLNRHGDHRRRRGNEQRQALGYSIVTDNTTTTASISSWTGAADTTMTNMSSILNETNHTEPSPPPPPPRMTTRANMISHHPVSPPPSPPKLPSLTFEANDDDGKNNNSPYAFSTLPFITRNHDREDNKEGEREEQEKEKEEREKGEEEGEEEGEEKERKQGEEEKDQETTEDKGEEKEREQGEEEEEDQETTEDNGTKDVISDLPSGTGALQTLSVTPSASLAKVQGLFPAISSSVSIVRGTDFHSRTKKKIRRGSNDSSCSEGTGTDKDRGWSSGSDDEVLPGAFHIVPSRPQRVTTSTIKSEKPNWYRPAGRRRRRASMGEQQGGRMSELAFMGEEDEPRRRGEHQEGGPQEKSPKRQRRQRRASIGESFTDLIVPCPPRLRRRWTVSESFQNGPLMGTLDDLEARILEKSMDGDLDCEDENYHSTDEWVNPFEAIPSSREINDIDHQSGNQRIRQGIGISYDGQASRLFVGRIPSRYLGQESFIENGDTDDNNDDNNGDNASANETESTTGKTRSTKNTLNTLIIFFVFVLIVVCAIVIPVGLGQRDKNVNKSPALFIRTWVDLQDFCSSANDDDTAINGESDRERTLQSLLEQALQFHTQFGLPERTEPLDACSSEAFALFFLSSLPTNSTTMSIDQPHLKNTFALSSLYFATQGWKWKRNDNWLSTEDNICRWFGVTCTLGNSNETKISSLVLIDNNLRGTLPESLNVLETQELLLPDNRISGTVSFSIGEMNQLQHLDLLGNDIEGRLPSELGELSLLSYLGMGGRDLNGPLPKEIASIPQLETLRIESNSDMGQIPRELATNATNLVELRLQGPFRNQFPREFWQSTSLRSLMLVDSFLSGALEFDHANTLWRHIEISRGNQFRNHVPTEIGKLTELEVLDINFNFLGGTIPTEIGLCTSMESIDLAANGIGGTMPTEMGNLSKLTSLVLDLNPITGTIPTELGGLGRLETLWLYGDLSVSSILGSFPARLCDIDTLSSILLSCETKLFKTCPVGCCECVKDESTLGVFRGEGRR